MARAKLKSLSSDLIDYSRLPTNKIAEKARAIVNAIDHGKCYTSFHGKRMRYNRDIVSVPVNRDYRIIYDSIDGDLCPRAVMSHEDYNAKKPAELS